MPGVVEASIEDATGVMAVGLIGGSNLDRIYLERGRAVVTQVYIQIGGSGTGEIKLGLE